jgi:hypothetical protein
MNKIKPYEKIASQFQMSKESAKYFLGSVQKSFKTEKPPHQFAARMNESGAWTHELITAPPAIVDDEDLYA